jgi:hypothetical protein
VQRVGLTDVAAVPGSVFIDNLLLASVRRVLTGAYQDILDEPLLHPAAPPALFAHDLVNLAGFLEALVCHEHLYVNSAFVDVWLTTLQSLGPKFDAVITGVEWSRDLQWAAESAIIKNHSWPRVVEGARVGLRDLSEVVSISTHHVGTREQIIEYDDSLEGLTSYEERTRPFGAGMDLVVGTGFYTTCSQIVGIPYRPSVLRSLYLRGTLKQSLRDFREDVGRLAFSMLEDTRERTVQAAELFSRMADMNQVETRVPAVLAWVLVNANSREDIIPRALQLRDSHGAQRFREWNAALITSIQDGDLRDAARRFREVANILTDLNRNFGFDAGAEGTISLGWGPAYVGKTFNLPAQLNLPIRFKRHALFLQDLYKTMLAVGRLNDHVDRLIVKPLPNRIRRDVAEGLSWDKVAETIVSHQNIYEPLSGNVDIEPGLSGTEYK